uniref:Odorant receptor n=1 Tax=Glossina morsitans morsitans TaxID=37546 RepID=A0A1B0GFW6_GLOMM
MIPQFLRDDYPLEKHLFLIPKFALRLIGFYPESKLNTPLLCWAFFNFLLLGYGSYAEFTYGIHYLTIDMQTALDALCPVLSSIMSFIKIFFIWWHRSEYKHLIEEVRRLTAAQSSRKNVHIKRKFFTIATRLTALVLFFGFNTSTAYTVRLVISNTILYLNQQPMPIYPLTCILSHWHGYITVAGFVGADGFFLGFCFYFATLFKMLQQDLSDALAVNNCKSVNATMYLALLDKNSQAIRCEADMVSNLTDIIRRHNEIAQLMKKFSSIMVGIVLSHFITSSLIIGTSFSGYAILVYIVHTCAVIAEISLYCLGGTAVMECVIPSSTKSSPGIMPFQNTETTNLTHTNFQNSSSSKRLANEELALQAYCSQWYDYSVRIQKMILLIMVRSQQTITVKVPFLTPALPMLAAVCIVIVYPAILRFAGSVITLFKTTI